MIGLVASLASGVAFVVSVLLAYSVSANHGEMVRWQLAEWIHVGTLNLDWTFRVDSLSTTMMLVVSGVGTLIHIYAIGYMHEDVRFKGDPGRFQSFLRLSQPVHRHDDDPRQRRLIPDALRGLGRRGIMLIPADRFLVRNGYCWRGPHGQTRMPPRKPSSSTASVTSDS